MNFWEKLKFLFTPIDPLKEEEDAQAYEDFLRDLSDGKYYEFAPFVKEPDEEPEPAKVEVPKPADIGIVLRSTNLRTCQMVGIRSHGILARYFNGFGGPTEWEIRKDVVWGLWSKRMPLEPMLVSTGGEAADFEMVCAAQVAFTVAYLVLSEQLEPAEDKVGVSLFN